MARSTNHLKRQADKAIFIRSELIKIAENANTTKSGLAFYFDDRDSNPLRNVTISQMNCGEFTQYHRHEFYEINFVIKGALHECVSGNIFTLNEGDMLFMSPSAFHSCYPAPDSRCINIIFRCEWLEQLTKVFNKFDADNYLSTLTKKDTYTIFYPSMQELSLTSEAKKLYDLSFLINRHQDLYEILHFENCVNEFLLLLTKCTPHNYSSVSGEQKGRPNYSPDDMIKYLNDNFYKVTLEEAAARFGYSSSQFHRIIKKNTGKSFTSTILSMRMMRARHLLLNTKIPIKDIASLLGLDSAEHFTRMFKKHRGITPKQYRQNFSRTK